MSRRSEVPFDNIESSHEYVTLLAEAIALALSEVESDIALANSSGANSGIANSGVDERRKEALRLVAFKLNKLSSHMAASRRILNDLRTLRRLLFEERRWQAVPSPAILETASQRTRQPSRLNSTPGIVPR